MHSMKQALICCVHGATLFIIIIIIITLFVCNKQVYEQVCNM